MSITLKTNQIKLKIQNENYQAPVVIADQTTSEHVAEVNTAITTTGNQQVSAIQTKGDEVLDSIPEDYTDLVEEVDELKSATDAICDVFNNVIINGIDKTDYEPNVYYDTRDAYIGGYRSHDSYIAINNYIPVKTGTTYYLLYVIDNIKYDFTSQKQVIFYNQSKEALSALTFTGNSFEVPNNNSIVYLRISFAPGDHLNEAILSNSISGYAPYEKKLVINENNMPQISMSSTTFVVNGINPANVKNDYGLDIRQANIGKIIQDSGGKVYLDYVQVSPGSKLFLHVFDNGTYVLSLKQCKVVLYDESYIPLYGYQLSNGHVSESDPSQAYITIPSGVKFARFSSAIAESVMVSEYGYAKVYEPYKICRQGVSGFEIINYRKSKIYGKKIGFDGDSICYGYGYRGGYARIIGAKYGTQIVNAGVNNATVAYSSNSPHVISSSVKTLDADCDYVLIEGGFNDSHKVDIPMGELSDYYYTENDTDLDVNTFYGGLESIARTLLTRFQNKKVGYLIQHKTSHTEYEPYHDAIIVVMQKYSIPVLDLHNMGAFNTNLPNLATQYTSGGDGVHPNYEGYSLFYVDKIAAFLESL